MTTTAAPLIAYLRQLEAKGQTHVNIDDEARLILREFYARAQANKTSKKPGLSAAKLAVENSQPPVTQTTDEIVTKGKTAADKINDLKRQAQTWPPARKLGSLRQTMVFSIGNPEAEIMFIGEAPGFDEERLTEPFIGMAGQKLDKIITAMKLARTDVYLSNIVKFRPSMPNQTTNNRKPTAEEVAACMPLVREEIKIVAPKVIIALGGTAAEALLDNKDTVTNMRGKFYDFAGIPLRVTYHPSYILHNEATTEKRKIWDDMLCVMELLDMPVSEKQRSYFL